MSNDLIASTRHMSKTSVSKVLRIAREKKISYESLKDMDDALYKLFFPQKKLAAKDIYELPEYSYVHEELKKVGVTLKLLWEEYRDRCKERGTISVGKTKFCDDYSKYCGAGELAALTP